MNSCKFYFLLLCFSLSLVVHAQGRPNVVIIVVDDIGFSDFGCYGSEINTPNIDGLAYNGIRFTQFYTENMCAPTRAALLTGRYPIRKFNQGNTITIAESLKKEGYQCHAVGKWHNHGEAILDRSAPLKRGFDNFYGTPQGAGSYFAPLTLTRDGDPAESEWQNSASFYYTDAISANSVKYIRETPSNTPLFLYTAYTAGHWPLHAKETDIGKQQGKYDIGWDSVRYGRFEKMKILGIIPKGTKLSNRDPKVPSWNTEANKTWQSDRMEVYAAQIEALDQGIGKIVKELKRTKRFENTLLLILSDNGACHVEYDENRTGPFLNKTTRKGNAILKGNIPGITPGLENTWQSYGRGWSNVSNTPFRLHKTFSHEGGIRAPLIIHWPDQIKKVGRLCDAPIHVIDLLPTVLDAMEIDYPSSYNGKSIKPFDGQSFRQLFGSKRNGSAKRTLFWDYANGRAVRKGNWKLVQKNDGPWELYNLKRDFIEENNLIEKRPEIVERLKNLWDAWYRKPTDYEFR